MRLRLIGGGAVQGLVAAVAPGFLLDYGVTVVGEFGAVGAMRAAFVDGSKPDARPGRRAGAARRARGGASGADIVILTRAIMEQLLAEGRVLGPALRDLGAVPTAIAVRYRDSPPALHDAADLRAALTAADALYLPDPTQATAGIHCAAVIARLGLTQALQPRLRIFANGAAAMQALAQAPERRPLGCTQATEILATPGVALVAPLPAEFALLTVYSAAIARDCVLPDLAQLLIDHLAGPAGAAARRACGFA